MIDCTALVADRPFLIAGPCVLESLDVAMTVAVELQAICADLDIPLVFKSSYDKANRTAGSSFRGPGLDRGLDWLAQIKSRTGLPVITDIHEPHQAAPVGEVVDVLQIRLHDLGEPVRAAIHSSCSALREMRVGDRIEERAESRHLPEITRDVSVEQIGDCRDAEEVGGNRSRPWLGPVEKDHDDGDGGDPYQRQDIGQIELQSVASRAAGARL